MNAPCVGSDARGVTRADRSRPVRAGVALTLVVFLSELACNLSAASGQLGDARIMRAVSSDLGSVLGGLAVELGLMLVVALLLTAVPCVLWGALSAVALDDLQRRCMLGRPARMACRCASWFAFLHVYYTLQLAIVPASRLAGSPLLWAVGALEDPFPVTPARYAVTACCAVLIISLGGWALLRSSRSRLALGAGVLLLVGAFGWVDLDRRPGPVRAFDAAGHVVLLGLDSMQMNRLSVGGAPRNIAPHIDGFLRSAHRFDNAWTPFARTYPSWLSILTGRYPARHGARFNLVPDQRLAPDNDYLAGVLARAGYSTFHGTDETRFSIIRPQFGYEQLFHPRMGVDDFFLGSFFDFSAANLARQFHLGHDLFPAIKDNRASVAYAPDLWTDNLLARLDALPRDEPALINLHLCGNHWPFSTPAPYAHMSDDPVEACVMMVDRQVGRILEFVNASGLAARGHVFLMSDHGDGWSGDPEDETNSHGDDFRSLHANRIVMGVQGPGVRPGVTDELVRTIDVFPTILDLLGVGLDRSRIDGESFASALAGTAIRSRDLFAETGLDRKVYGVKQLLERHAVWYAVDPATRLVHMRPEGVEEFMDYKSYMLIRDDLRLVVTPYLERFELFAFDARGDGVADDVPAPADPEARAVLLRDLAEHFGLDVAGLQRMAADKRFLGAHVTAEQPPTAAR